MKIIWGKHVWKALHYIALGYPNNPTIQQKEDYKMFYELLKSVLPCKLCSNHYIDHLKQYPLSEDVLKNKDNLLKWTIELHNLVNEQLGYPILSYNDALNEINSYETCHKKNYNYYLLIIFILFSFILFIIYLYKKEFLNNIKWKN